MLSRFWSARRMLIKHKQRLFIIINERYFGKNVAELLRLLLPNTH